MLGEEEVMCGLLKKQGSVKISKATERLEECWREGLKGTDWLAALVNTSNHLDHIAREWYFYINIHPLIKYLLSDYNILQLNIIQLLHLSANPYRNHTMQQGLNYLY